MKADGGYTNTKTSEIVGFYKEGFSSVEIAEKCGCNSTYVGIVLRRKGLEFTDEQKQRSKDITNRRISEKLTNPNGAIKLIESVGNFKYVGGYTHYDCL